MAFPLGLCSAVFKVHIICKYVFVNSGFAKSVECVMLCQRWQPEEETEDYVIPERKAPVKRREVYAPEHYERL